ncbi:MAG: hypothetical protein GY868_21760 [Deltaproteobacteria bacterium]|nr:hypothetical protein [Deltaproteobacteria bacterium]
MANKEKLRVLLPLCLFLCGLLFRVSASWAASPDDSPVVKNKTAVQNETVVYDEATGLISVHAENGSLRRILAQISRHTQVKFLMDPAAERVVSVSLEKKPLEQGLKLIMHNAGLSHATIYGKKSIQGRPPKIVPISMKILPKGKTDTSSLVPVEPGPYKPANNTRRTIFDLTEKDLKDMPEEGAKRLKERLGNIKERQSKRAAERELKKAERKQRQGELKQRREEERNARRSDRENAPWRSEPDSDSYSE